jgi:hypothetical protein
MAFNEPVRPSFPVRPPRWRGFVICAFIKIYSALIMKLVFGHKAKITNSSLIAKIVAVMLRAD